MGRTSFAELEAHPHGLILTKGKPVDFISELRTPDKKVHFDVPEFMAAAARLDLKPEKKNKEYPLVLSTTCRTFANVNTIYKNEKWIAKHMPENSLVMHPDDAGALGIKDRERVRLATRSGTGDVPVAFSEDVLRSTVYLSHGWGLYSRDPKDLSGKLCGTAASVFLPDDEGDEFTGMPFYSGLPCKVEKIKKTAAKKAVKKTTTKKSKAKKKTGPVKGRG